MAAALVLAVLMAQALLPTVVPFAAASSDSLPATSIPLGSLTASFTFSPTQPVVGQTVTFTGSASGGSPPYTYNWNFGDTLTDTGQTVYHAYASARTFTVTLTVNDTAGTGSNNVTTSSQSVVVTAPLTASFTFTPLTPAAGDTVFFSTTASGGTPPYTYAWTFGDGGAGTGATPTHTYVSAGTYSVALTLTDSASHTTTTSQSIVVTAALAVSFTFSPLSPAVGDTVTFSATASGGTSPYTYAWNFGDGGTGSGAGPTHAYATAGTYTITLMASDSEGHSATASSPIVVSSTLSADLTYSPTLPSAGETVSFAATAHGGTSPYTFSWTFGDGSTGTGATVTHAYASAGTYTVTVAISDSAGHSTSVTASVVVSPKLEAGFTFSPTSPATGDSVSFTATATGGTPPYTYAWNFGDGGTGSGATASHVFTTAGTFSVTLSVSDNVGHTTEVSKSVSVTGGLGATFTFSPAQPVIGDTVVFAASVSGGTPPYMYTWSFGDASTGAGATTTHTYASAGTFTVVLAVKDAASHNTSVTRSVTVVPPLTGSFTYSPSPPLVFEQITFTATASGGTPPYVYAWDFGDGSTASGATVSHPYASPGTFNVTVRIIDAQGRILSMSQNVEVFYLLAAGFTVSQVFPEIGEAVSFSAVARGADPPYTFSWDFGDGATAAGANVSHAYASAGAVTVTLTAIDAQDHTATVTKSVVVTPPLVLGVHVSQSEPVVGEAVNFTALPGGGTPPYQFNWTFGDGSNGTGAVVNHSYRAVGSYIVALTVFDSSGHNASAYRVVSAAALFLANFTFVPVRPLAGENITFAVNASGGTLPYSYAWKLGDGWTSLEAVVHHAYAAPGTYTATLTVEDAGGHILQITRSVSVGYPLLVTFVFSPTRPTTGTTISFVGNASGGEPPYTYTWAFGDGASSHALATNHTFSDFGLSATHVVVFTACDAAGRCVSASESIGFGNLFLISFLVEIGLAVPVVVWWVLTRRPRTAREE